MLRLSEDMGLPHKERGLRLGEGVCLGDELKSHPFSVHFSDLFLSKKTYLCAEIWNN